LHHHIGAAVLQRRRTIVTIALLQRLLLLLLLVRPTGHFRAPISGTQARVRLRDLVAIGAVLPHIAVLVVVVEPLGALRIVIAILLSAACVALRLLCLRIAVVAVLELVVAVLVLVDLGVVYVMRRAVVLEWSVAVLGAGLRRVRFTPGRV
jgi:hypothetical protein